MTLRKVSKRTALCLFGALLAMGAPCGWYVVSQFVGVESRELILYIYLTFSTALVFSLSGFYLGRVIDKTEYDSERDTLTGAFNLSAFVSISTAIARISQRHSKPFSMIMFDIDFFKRINDEHDHSFGNFVLQELVAILTKTLRKSDIVARFGGDEFLIALPDTNETDARSVAEKILRAVATHKFEQGTNQHAVTLSLGVAKVDLARESCIQEAIDAADAALIAAKRAGRNQVCAQAA
jgi:diguanylate cyclase